MGQRFIGMIVFSPSSNDHFAAVFHVAENSNAGSGSINSYRSHRNELLAQTDWTQTEDRPLDLHMKEMYRAYRRFLRDFPQTHDLEIDETARLSMIINCPKPWRSSCLVCFAIFGRFWRFWGKRFSRENVPEMMELDEGGIFVERKNWQKMGKRGKTAFPLAPHACGGAHEKQRWWRQFSTFSD